MVILPLGIINPVIRLTTPDAVYLQTVTIDGTKVNTCYCFNLKGVELELTAITVADWKVGEGIPGQYSAITTYPTFRGNDNQSIYLYYDTGIEQQITFTADGERTAKPDGRTIVKITDATAQRNVIYDAAVQGNAPIVLRSMYIDLRPYLN